MRGFLNLLLFTGSVFALAAFASAATVSVFDTSGQLRAESEAGEANSAVQFSVSAADGAPADAIEVILTNQQTGEAITAISSNGSIVFESVAPGSWTVSTSAAGITFSNVSIVPAMMAGAVSGIGLGTGVAAVAGVGAVTATTIAVTQNSSDSTPVSPAS